MMEEDKKQVIEAGPTGSFFKDPWRVGMALLIILLLAYIVTMPRAQQLPSGGNNQTGSNPASNLTANLSNGTHTVNVKLTIVNDASCILCDTSSIESSLRSVISNLTVTNVSYSSNEGKALLQQYNASGVPLYVFDSSIAQDPGYSNLSVYLRKSGSTYMLMVQPVKFLNMKEQNNTIELFVMSHGQYGVRVENYTKELLAALPDLKFGGIHFLATDLGNGSFSSPNGPGEIAEDLRQVCIMKYYPGKIMNYTACIAADYNNSGSIWQNCSSASGIDTAKIQGCSTGDEGKVLLSGNIALSKSLGIYASPTALLNNDTLVNGNYLTSAKLIEEVTCVYSPAMSGCSKILSGVGNSTAGAGGTG